MRQYREIRGELGDDTLLLFRLGDFYELFHDDAERGARLLGITLTQRHGMPMAGIPYHTSDSYIQKLLDQGVKVALCDQVETPQPGKLVRRQLTRIITPGTRMADSQIEARRNHFLLALALDRTRLNAAWLDLTTGEFVIASETDAQALFAVFAGLDPREVVVPERQSETWSETGELAEFARSFAQLGDGRAVTPLPDDRFDRETGARAVREALGVLHLEGFGIAADHPALGAAGALIDYASESLCGAPANLGRLREYRAEQNLLVDPATQRNLEIFKSAANTRQGSLLAAMDGTVTASGARLLERWLGAPALDLEEIRRRQACVGEFVAAPGIAADLRETLSGIRDIERILGRLQNRMRNPRELGGVRETLRRLPAAAAWLLEFPETPVGAMAGRIDDFSALSDLLDRALADELPGAVQDGGAIREGYDDELDRLRSLSRDNKTWIADLERREQERTGIRNLRIRYNGAFGYYLEVTKSQLDRVPEDYLRKQTMKNAERFYTEALKEREREIMRAEETSVAREETLFAELVDAVLERAEDLKTTAAALAELDVFLGWASLARDWDYCRPELDESDALEIDQGRHPVVEQMMRAERQGLAGTRAFVPNDAALAASGSGEPPQIALITGPNMAGKSTFIRQVALIVLMAQSGAWTPARACRVGLVDRIFSRVGASDELARGHSTFMVEMNETANILNNASERSLVVLDEIGRGTSTYDGLSIAWAVAEHLHNGNAPVDEDGGAALAQAGPRTLFATHYHELTQLAHSLDRLRNFSVAVKEWNDEIIFVRQVVPGAADRSYGIQVARLAGLPPSVIARAKSILGRLEGDAASHNLLRRRLKRERAGESTEAEDAQLSLF